MSNIINLDGTVKDCLPNNELNISVIVSFENAEQEIFDMHLNLDETGYWHDENALAGIDWSTVFDRNAKITNINKMEYVSFYGQLLKMIDHNLKTDNAYNKISLSFDYDKLLQHKSFVGMPQWSKIYNNNKFYWPAAEHTFEAFFNLEKAA